MYITKTKRLICRLTDDKGLSLIELLIASAILLLVLAVGYTFLNFGQTSFVRGEERADLQQNARMALDFISDQVRIAEIVVILPAGHDYSDLEGYGIDVDYEGEEEIYTYQIYVENGSIFYSKLAQGVEEVTLLENISENIDFDLNFAVNNNSGNILDIYLSSTEKASGTLFDLETEILILNLSSGDIIDLSAGNGAIVLYQIPAPPDPTIRGILLDPSLIYYGYVPEDLDYISVDISTFRLEGREATASLYWLDVENNLKSLLQGVTLAAIETELETIIFNDVPLDSLNIGVYPVEVIVEGIEFPYPRYFDVREARIFADEIIFISLSGDPRYRVDITTEGVLDGIKAEIVKAWEIDNPDVNLLRDPETPPYGFIQDDSVSIEFKTSPSSLDWNSNVYYAEISVEGPAENVIVEFVLN